MAVRQYVGARYVPKFYQNSKNPLSSEWEDGVAYEALTVVTYNNSSYTSKIPVPAGTGNPASNPTYWAITGAYNAQVEQYRKETEEAVTFIESIYNKNYIFIGDSYGAGESSEGTTTGWCEGVSNKLQNSFYAYKGGAGFTVNGNTFLMLIQSLSNKISDKNTITDIIVCGGYNDFNSNETTLVNAITNFLSYCKTNYPNATVSIGFIASSTRDNDREILSEKTIYYYKEGAVSLDNGCYMANAEFILKPSYLIGTDGVHPTHTGYNELINQIYNYCKNGNISVLYNFTANIAGLTAICTVNNNITNITIKGLLNASQFNVEIDGQSSADNTYTEIGTCDNIYGFNTNNLASINIPCIFCTITNEEGAVCFEDLYGTISIMDGKVYASINRADMTIYTRSYKINQTNVLLNSFSVPTIMI